MVTQVLDLLEAGKDFAEIRADYFPISRMTIFAPVSALPASWYKMKTFISPKSKWPHDSGRSLRLRSHGPHRASRGYSITPLRAIAAVDSANPEVLALSVSRNWILLTNDLDFGDIIRYPPDQHCGVIVLRIRPRNEQRCTRFSFASFQNLLANN